MGWFIRGGGGGGGGEAFRRLYTYWRYRIMKVSYHRVENELVRMGAQYLKQGSKFVPLVDLQLKHPPIMAQNLHDVCGYIEASWIEFPSKKRLHIVWQLLFGVSVCVLLDQKLYPESMMLYSLITPRQCIMSVFRCEGQGPSQNLDKYEAVSAQHFIHVYSTDAIMISHLLCRLLPMLKHT